MAIKEYAKRLMEQNELYRDIAAQKETLWLNDRYLPFEMTDALCGLVVSDRDIADAEERLRRFAPYIRKCFPETESSAGLIESPLREIGNMKACLEEKCGGPVPGRLLLKMDSHLAIAGSVKARGGIYEVLKHAEDLVLEHHMLDAGKDYTQFSEPRIKDFLHDFTVQVGSTGNLGLSIGIMSAHLGFRVKVHMSADAKQWKKDMLRGKGVEVIEYEDDYSKAVAEGRRQSAKDPKSYFVDDEYSVPLFLGYAVAAGRLKTQLEDMGITIDQEHPLIVYIPCGVGGAPGGICYGLKRVFKNDVHVFFCEPVLFPSVLLGMATDRYEAVNVSDFGLGGLSAADGLACASPSGFVTRLDGNLVRGDFTVSDAKLFDYLRMLKQTEDIFIEPSACAAFAGVVREKPCFEKGALENAIQICWATGGSLVPQEMKEAYLNTYMK